MMTTPDPPIVAILRGVTSQRVVAVTDAIYQAGIRIVEVPLNSPDPYHSIEQLAKRGWTGLTVGAGTVLDVADVHRTQAAGGRLVVAPNCNDDVIRGALAIGMTVMPGFATATEAFAAIKAGATRLKLFPALSYGPRHLAALRAVLPAEVEVYPVGGIGADDFEPWLAAGAGGFGFGSEIFRPDYSLPDIGRRARQLVTGLREAHMRISAL
jgi:2-dehydro-3-deoxyphosphogalactonate aldolase